MPLSDTVHIYNFTQFTVNDTVGNSEYIKSDEIMNSELEMMRKKPVTVSFKVTSRHLPSAAQENKELLNSTNHSAAMFGKTQPV